ncbi:hypothetical protein C4J81_03000 [Deltaproteobacteria bacterium Smac51]|nr:hypothetical protein C4J81_03000 [Deltaproteobacteria bacterium Smac51]
MRRVLKNNSGFTLIETLVALVIIVVGFLAAIAMQSRAIGAGIMADDITAAAFLAESKIEQFQVTPTNLISEKMREDELLIGRDGASGGKFSRFTTYEKTTPTNLNDTVTVRVTWKNPFGSERSVVYTAVLLRR